MKLLNCFLFLMISCAAPSSAPVESAAIAAKISSAKINGIGIAASSQPIDQSEFNTLREVNANYVCLLPFAFVREGSPEVHYNSGFQEWGERPEGVASCIRMAHDHGLKVMIKPQLWISHGEYSGYLSFQNEDDWKKFEMYYTKYIFKLLTVADTTHAEIFCLGTELDSFVNQRTTYWSWLVDTARKVYHGKLTYAENWDCYDRFPLWEKLDYIGISAYFPLSESKTPTVDELKKAWQQNVSMLKNVSEQKKKQVLFAEYGYRSIDCCTSKPWDSYSDAQPNPTAQANAYTAIFESFWNQPWFAGGFSWKWFDSHSNGDVPMETEYTPQGKPAMKVLEQWYSR
ncbi:MAG TPA: hypothetical protein VE978_28220 [Chitinophagales bacterium]|nr:hypothetical protein [Chitinophagales bacterium]